MRLSFLSKFFGFGSHSPSGHEPMPSAPTTLSEPVATTVLEWLSWEGESFNETLTWVPGTAH